MQILGLNKTTLLDYPEHVAATVFTGGCNFRCPFCHNMDLVLGEVEPALSTEDFFAFLEKRKGILDGVCITGGEPTLQKDLPDFIRGIRDKGYLVKLDTNGYRPKVLEELLRENLLDYVAMDIKSSVENYPRVTGMADLDVTGIQESVSLLKSAGIPYEFRTTVVKGLHRIDEFDEIGRWLQGAEAYFLQAFRENEKVPDKSLSSFSEAEMREMKQLAERYIERVELRGI
ncbi:MAG: anaerobic ribonucleoside-triphosphate reductase activating protein [Acetatifactor sp.]|nr:anaerobic ribonucleoside-triphosphate reductase activating protein [Acetatifactor sp.]